MPSTYTFNEIVIAASDCVTRGVEEAKAAVACNMALYKVWMAYDWRETVADIPPFYLVPFKQNYGAPAVSVPSDFFGWRRAYYHNIAAGGQVPFTKELTCPGDLAVTDYQALPTEICYQPSTQKFRVFPLPPASAVSPFHIIDGKYKKRPVISISGTSTTINKVTTAYLNAALLPFDDSFMPMWLEAVKWGMMTLACDPKAGMVQEQNGVSGYTGQLAIMMAAIGQMADAEAGELAAPPRYPKEPLMKTHIWGGW